MKKKFKIIIYINNEDKVIVSDIRYFKDYLASKLYEEIFTDI